MVIVEPLIVIVVSVTIGEEVLRVMTELTQPDDTVVKMPGRSVIVSVVVGVTMAIVVVEMNVPVDV